MQRKDHKIFVKQNRNIFGFSHTFESEVQNKFQQTNKNKINHISDNHIKFEVSLHFLAIWPTVWHQADQHYKVF